MSELIISKLDAARRQLEMAVRLYFSEGDPVSIHTLTAAAYNVIRDINKNQGGAPMLVKEAGLQVVKLEYRDEFRKIINKAENFFKHADDDSNETLQFNPGISEYLILDACDKYRTLTGEAVPNFLVFMRWFELQHPNLLKVPDEQESVRTALKATGVTDNRARFYAIALPAISQSLVKSPTPPTPSAPQR